jgi:rfaE bifunctional protein nucleotidyltransferase chain/domain
MTQADSSADSGSMFSIYKVVNLEALLAARARHRAHGKTVVWTNGCFDLLHVGHVRSLQAARAFGDILVVGVNSDASVRGLKGSSRPIVPARERVEILAALECVNHVILFEDPDPAAVLECLQPDVHCKGADYAPPHGKPIPEANVIRSYGGRIQFLPLVPDISTSDLVTRIREAGH